MVRKTGLAHIDSRPYELAIARAHRAPEMLEGYRAEAARIGSPLTELEEASIYPVYRAFRIDMVAWLLDGGARAGSFDVPAIEGQLARGGA